MTINITVEDINSEFSDETRDLFYEWLHRAVDERLDAGRDPERHSLEELYVNIEVEFEESE